MTNLINDILMISVLKPKVTVSMHDVRICPLLSDVCSTLTPCHRVSGCRDKLQTSCHLCNEGQIRELLNNLINNAIKYNKPGGKVFVTITSEEMILSSLLKIPVGSRGSTSQDIRAFYRVIGKQKWVEPVWDYP